MSFQVNRRVGWVTFDAHWTWAHGMSNYLNLENPYAPLFWNRDFLAKHRLVFNTMWELPVGRGRRYFGNMPRAVDEVFGGWNIAWVTYLQSGQYFSPSFSDDDPSNTNTFGGLPDRVCNGNLPPGERRLDRWFDTSCFVPPPPGRFGNSGVNVLEGPGLHAHNVTLLKKFQLTERLRFDLMALVSEPFQSPEFPLSGCRHFHLRSRSDRRNARPLFRGESRTPDGGDQRPYPILIRIRCVMTTHSKSAGLALGTEHDDLAKSQTCCWADGISGLGGLRSSLDHL